MERIGVNSVRELLNSHGFSFTKSLGQNFLIDGNIPEKIVRLSEINSSNGVFEAGAGIGALTIELSRSAGQVLAVEIDKRLLPILDDVLSDKKNVEIIHGDFLKVDISDLVKTKMQGLKPVVCANLPYNITSPAISAFIHAEVFDHITVMVQREVAQRICAVPNSPEYGAFTVFVNYHTKPEILFDVSPDCFMPKPKVWSSVVRMKTKTEKLFEQKDEKLFFSLVKAAFSQRRKTLVNALHGSFGRSMSKNEISSIIEEGGFIALTRGETLGVEDYAKLVPLFRGHIDPHEKES